MCTQCYDKARAAAEALEELARSAEEEVMRTPKKQRATTRPTPSCTPEQKRALHKVQQTEFGQRGLTSSPATNARLVLAVEQEMAAGSPCQQAGMSYNAVLNRIAEREHVSPNKLRELHGTAANGGSMENKPVKRTTRADPEHMLYRQLGRSVQVEEFIFKWLAAAQENGTYTSVPLLQAELKQKMNVGVPKETLRTWLHSMRIDFGKRKLSPLPMSYINCLIRRYIADYAQLLREEQEGKIVLVWMDESYIHAGYSSARGWFLNSEKAAVVKGRVRGTEKGKRIIIIHAMTRFGMLEVPISEEDMSDCLGKELPSAGVVSHELSVEAGDREDYHDTMDGEKFVAWIKNRLLVAFEAKFPERKMCLILDNAKYHKARGEDWISPSGMLKADMAEQLIGWDIMQIHDGAQVWPAGSYHMDAKGGKVPTADLLRDVMKSWLLSHAKNSTLVEQAMEKHQLLYTPPYESWLQPIEMVWATVKKQVAMLARRDRKWQETQEQTRSILSKLTAEQCANIIGRVEKDMSAWLQSAAAGAHLGQWSSLEQLVAAKHEDVAQHGDMAPENFEDIEEAARGSQKAASTKEKREKREVVVQVKQQNVRRGGRVRKQVQCTSYSLFI
jgi:hypothetical protein